MKYCYDYIFLQYILTLLATFIECIDIEYYLPLQLHNFQRNVYTIKCHNQTYVKTHYCKKLSPNWIGLRESIHRGCR